MHALVGILEQGILWSLLGVGLFITFRILRFPDLTVEGSLPLGAAICVKLIVTGYNPIIATMLAMVGGGILGAITGILYTKLKVPMLLAGILTMTAAYSINLRIMGTSNLAIKDNPTIYSFDLVQSIPTIYQDTVVALGLTIIFILLVSYFLYSNIGQSFIAAGDNEIMAESIGINTNMMKLLGLIISNALVSLVGAIVAQSNSFADIGMGVGTIVIALVSIIIVELLFKTLSLMQRLFSIVFGSIIYRFLIYVVLSVGLNQNDINLISSLVLVVCFLVPYTNNKFKKYNKFKH